MDNLAADFIINLTEPLQAEYNLGESNPINCTFEVYASGTVWGSISGDINNQTDLIELIENNYNDLEGQITILDTKVDNNYNELSNGLIEANQDILDLTNTVNSNFTTLNNKIDEINIDLSADISELNTAIQNEAATRAENDTLLQNNINTLSQTVTANYNTLDGKIDTEISDRTTADTTLQGNIDTLSDTVTNNYNSLDARITTNTGNIAINTGNITTINSKIPNQASSSNQLADKDFVNSSIATNTANFIGTFNSVAELEAYSGTLTNNDYAFVATTDAVGNTLYDRYKWNGSEWLFEYELNNSSFTAQQWASINSGATSTNIGQITINANSIADLQTNKQDVISDLTTIRSNALAGKNASDTIATYGNIVTHNVGEFATSSQGALADTALQPNDNISELTNDAGYITAASLPTVNNGTLTIQANGTTVGTFTANQAGNTTANIVVPDSATWGNITGTLSNQTDLQSALDGKQDTISDLSTIRSGASAGATALQPNDNITELVNNAGYISGITSSDVTTALGYTPYNSSNPNGYITASALNGYATENWVTNQNYVNGTALTNTLADYVLSSDLSTTLSNYVTTNTTQTISGTKTYTGAVHFIGSGDNDAVFISTNTRFNVEGTSQTVLGFAASTFYVNHTSYELLLRGSGTRPRYNTSTLALTSDIPNTSNLANKDLSNLSSTGNSKFQEPLVSGTNIKTINGSSILGSGDITIQSAPDTDNVTISTNSDDELQTIGVIDNNSGNAIKTWTGTKAQYDAIVTKDATTLYNITDDTDVTLSLLELLYPVGSLYIATSNVNVCPLSVLGIGTWQLKTNSTIVTDINSTAPVVGNGMAMGITDGTNYTGLIGSGGWELGSRGSVYNKSIGSSASGGSSLGDEIAVGLTTDATKSGIQANITSTTISVTIWERIS